MPKIVPNNPINRPPTEEAIWEDFHATIQNNELIVKIALRSNPIGDPVTLRYDSDGVVISFRGQQQIIDRPNAAQQLLAGTNLTEIVLTQVMNDMGIQGTVVP